jgi:hypothetical protein
LRARCIGMSTPPLPFASAPIIRQSAINEQMLISGDISPLLDLTVPSVASSGYATQYKYRGRRYLGHGSPLNWRPLPHENSAALQVVANCLRHRSSRGASSLDLRGNAKERSALIEIYPISATGRHQFRIHFARVRPCKNASRYAEGRYRAARGQTTGCPLRSAQERA